MKIVFFGSGEFALTSLKALTDTCHQIMAVVTPSDKKAGRGLKVTPVPVKQFALEKKIAVFQPECPNTQTVFFNNLKKIKADVFVVVSYGHILNKRIIGLPRFFSINLHPSLLPEYRGAAPINWAVINGDKKTGVSVIKMTAKMDAGPLLCQKEEIIFKKDTSISLAGRLAELGKKVLIESLDLIEDGRAVLIPQEEEKATWAPKLTKEDALIDFNLPAEKLYNKIRGLAGWPTAYTFFNNKRIEILEADYEFGGAGALPAQIVEVSDSEVRTAAGEGILILKRVKPEGKREMPAPDFARGARLKKGDKFSSPPQIGGHNT